MRAEGVELLAGLDELAVMGFAEVLPRIPYFRDLERRLEEVLLRRDVRLVVPIDFPGFNMRVARCTKRLGRRVLWYVAPQVWAWRERRSRTLADVADRVAVILPFEESFLTRRGVRASFVGNPVQDAVNGSVGDGGRAFRAEWGLDAAAPLLAILPGSREQEVRRHLDIFLGAVELVRRDRPDVVPVLARTPSLPGTLFGDWPHPQVTDARGLLRAATAALVKSGTGALEAAVEGTPTVVAYRTSRPTWFLARRLLRVDHVALPNLVAGREVVPELLQDAATPSALASHLVSLLAPDGHERARQIEGLGEVSAKLGSPGVAGRVADMAIELMGGRP